MAKYAVSLDRSPLTFFLCPYTLEEYLDRPAAVMFSKPITPRDCIKYLANKLGGIHMDPNLTDAPGKPPHATLLQAHIGFFIGNEPAVFNIFRGSAALLWRCFAPLREEIAEAQAKRPAAPPGPPRRPRRS